MLTLPPPDSAPPPSPEHARPQPRSTLYADAASKAAERLQREVTYKSKPRNIIVVGWWAHTPPPLPHAPCGAPGRAPA
jgi:hypothetical protein